MMLISNGFSMMSQEQAYADPAYDQGYGQAQQYSQYSGQGGY